MGDMIGALFGRLAWLLSLPAAFGLFLFFGRVTDEQAAATQLDMIGVIAEDWIRETFQQRVADTAAGVREYVPSTDQSANRTTTFVVPATYSARNVFGQSIVVKVLQPTPGSTPAKIYALVQTCGGDTVPAADAARAAGMVANGAYISSLAPTVITSADGSMLPQPVASYDTATCPATPGHLAKWIILDGGQVRPPFVHVYKIGSDTEPNRMHTTLYMGGNTVEEVLDVKLTNGKWLSSAVMDAEIVQDGASVVKPTCQHGAPAIYVGLATISDETVGRPIVAAQGYAIDNGTTWTVKVPVYTTDANGSQTRAVPAGPWARALYITKCQ